MYTGSAFAHVAILVERYQKALFPPVFWFKESFLMTVYPDIAVRLNLLAYNTVLQYNTIRIIVHK